MIINNNYKINVVYLLNHIMFMKITKLAISSVHVYYNILKG